MHQPPDNTVLLHDAGRQRWLLFRDPVSVLRASTVAEVVPLLHAVAHAVEGRSLYAAGFVSYEAAPAFDAALRTHDAAGFPPAWFGLYGPPEEVASPASEVGDLPAMDWQPSVSIASYRRAIRRIHEYIGAGDTYQVNYTLRLRAPSSPDPWLLFRRMVRAQGPGYAGWVALPDWTIGCASPELFFLQDGERIESRPMKGTADRGLWSADDHARARWLQRSRKNRAENVMIVDMVRNDLGRIAIPGSVCVPRLFEVERYPTVWQMTSTVRALTRAPLPEIFAALFPAASITGAPKVRTMELIADLEDSPRRIYTGTLGYLAPGRQAQFNVAIRTVLTDRSHGTAGYGVGGGIVWDSNARAEADECWVKARVLSQDVPEFGLIETLRWDPGEGYALIDRHLARLADSAEYFAFPCPLPTIRTRLVELAASFARAPQRVRLLLDAAGALRLEAAPLQPLAQPWRVCLARRPVSSRDRFLYHKTTVRRPYQEALAGCPGFPDVLLWNERGELTESCIANIVAELDGEWVTPPLGCGLLPGTCRDELLATGQVRERVVRVADLLRCTRVRLANSVRGLWDVEVVRD